MGVGSKKRRELWATRAHVCALCGKEILCYDAMDVDHILPKSLGGPDDDDNLQLTHRSCNISKGNRSWVPRCNYEANEQDREIWNEIVGATYSAFAEMIPISVVVRRLDKYTVQEVLRAYYNMKCRGFNTVIMEDIDVLIYEGYEVDKCEYCGDKYAFRKSEINIYKLYNRPIFGPIGTLGLHRYFTEGWTTAGLYGPATRDVVEDELRGMITEEWRATKPGELQESEFESLKILNWIRSGKLGLYTSCGGSGSSCCEDDVIIPGSFAKNVLHIAELDQRYTLMSEYLDILPHRDRCTLKPYSYPLYGCVKTYDTYSDKIVWITIFFTYAKTTTDRAKFKVDTRQGRLFGPYYFDGGRCDDE